MSQYMLLLHECPSEMPDLSPEEIQALIGRYKAWSQKMAEAGKLAGGNKLEDRTGRVLRPNGKGVQVSDGPFTETKEVVGGYFILEAASFDEAVELSKDCPHLDFGAIEIRAIEIV